MMTDSEFLVHADAQLNEIEEWLLNSNDEDYDCVRQGNVLTIDVFDLKQIVVNIQTPMQEIWFASPYGGRHFKMDPQDPTVWRDSRTGKTLREVIQATIDKISGYVNG